jgi:prepilin-type N-terminal cleavage/methylation domain-containing protein
MTSFRRPPPPPNGFSLVEVLVSAAITGLVILGVANLWGQSSQMFQQLRQRNSQEALIEEDTATMEDLAYRYTCCPGSPCTTNPSDVAASATCKGEEGSGTPDIGTEYYYFPYYSNTATTTPNIDAFRDLCKNRTLVTALANQMADAPKSKAFTDRGLTRLVVVDNASLHRVRVDYTGTNLQRSSMVVPTAARWCFEGSP